MARFRDGEGRVTLVTQRHLVSVDDPHLAALETVLVAENWSEDATVRSGIDGNVANAGVESYRQLAGRHLSVRHTDVADPETVVLVAETVQSGIRIAIAERLRPRRATAVSARTVHQAPGRVHQHLIIHLRQGRPAHVEKVVGIFTSRDRAIAECSLTATATVQRAATFGEIAADHRAAWERLWARSALWVDVGGRTPTIVNLHRLHLLQSVSPHTAHLDASVTARAARRGVPRPRLLGRALRLPLVQLPVPRAHPFVAAVAAPASGPGPPAGTRRGDRGAMSRGRATRPDGRRRPPSCSTHARAAGSPTTYRQLHASLAIAYNTWSYYQATGDVESLVHFGAELMIEKARFWASIARWDPARQRYDIRGVMGPDEFHDGPVGDPGAGVINNAYTNVMAAWVLWRTATLVGMLRGRGGAQVFERLDLRPEELAHWVYEGTRLVVPFDRAARIAQFEGYDGLEELDWNAYRTRYGTSDGSTSSSRPRVIRRTGTSWPSRPTCSCSSSC